jgi:hydroxymethylglutaryl-CoA synthase
MNLDVLVKQRVRADPGLERHLARALRVTGQKAIRFPEPGEDSAAIAATAAYRLFKAPFARARSVRHLAVGTETEVDHSKPVSAYLQGMLQRTGVALPDSLSSFEVKHACAGGAIALVSVAAMLAGGGRKEDSGVVVSTDIARYETRSTAEITQGAGAVAVSVERAPRLVTLDLATMGFHSRDVDDFFRPLSSPTARVNGSYSMRCYEESLAGAFFDYCSRSGQEPKKALRDTDYFVLHTPFRNMPGAAMEKLLGEVLGLTPEAARAFLQEKNFDAAVDPFANIGNLYTGSIPAGLAFLLDDRFKAHGRGIVGKRILIASYGSGNTMVMIAATVAADAPEVLMSWELDKVFTSARQASFEEYEQWTSGLSLPSAEHGAERHGAAVNGAYGAAADTFVLSGIRKDGYREYSFRDARVAQRESSDDLHRSVALSG